MRCDMNYEPKFVEGYSIEDCKSEIKWFYDRQYAHGYAIDYPRIWDLEYTIEKIRSNINIDRRF
jgi:hypothetical protein